jgi:2-polyprenyl-3-methyl-5-hydroxy-6-metoxy-1,4-benzoquinol methylase
MLNSNQKVYQNTGNKDVLKHIIKANAIILDIGCGRGDNASILQSNGHIVDGITLSELEQKEAIQYCRNVYIFNLENGLPEVIKNNKYDYIICSHVLEHIAYPNSLLKDINQVLTIEGRLIVALPNVMHYKSRLKLMFGNFNYEETGIWDYTHLRWYTFKTGAELFINNKMIVDKAYVTGEIPWLTVLGVIPENFRRKIFSILLKISKGFFSNQLIYVLKK